MTSVGMGIRNQIPRSSSGNIKDIAKKVGAGKAFKNSCNILLVKAYYILVGKKDFKVNWEEDTFTANFAYILQAICDDISYPYSIIYQQHQLTKSILAGSSRAQTAKRMDIVFTTFSNVRLNYGIEAKIISESDFEKRNAKSLCKEYVISGIDRFINGTYNMDGCIIGYVMNGSPDSIVNYINGILKDSNRDKEKIKNKHCIDNYDYCYISKHRSIILQHFLFKFLIS